MAIQKSGVKDRFLDNKKVLLKGRSRPKNLEKSIDGLSYNQFSSEIGPKDCMAIQKKGVKDRFLDIKKGTFERSI